ncbi:nucleoside hydrolase [bacterium]|nr:nucleoside hydrolase [bacterium]
MKHVLVMVAVFLMWCCSGVSTGNAQGKEKMKIIFDTDLAGDIDDAFAHALVQVSPEFEILGITTADGPTDLRARVSCRMLYECGQEHIPVAVGRRTRENSALPPQMTWGEGFDKFKPVKESAADFIIRNLRKYPGQVTIISVGPVTNLADVIDKDPEAWKMVKEVYSMFGSFYMGYNGGPAPDAEWNVRADIKSAQKFISSGVPITLAGLDVTTIVKYNKDRRLHLFMRSSPLTDAVCGLYTLWAGTDMNRDPTLFDPVAVTMTITDRFVTTRNAHVTVDDEGYTLIDESRPPNCRVGMHINTEAFLDWLTLRLLNQNLSR